MKLHSHIQLSVLETLAFFSLFSKKLTEDEILQYFYVDRERDEFAEYARTHRREITEGVQFVLKTTKWIAKDSHGYSLSHTEYATSEVEHFLAQNKLTQRSRRFLPFIESTPFLRMVAIGNTLAFGAPEDTRSDIDLFVVSKKDYVWFTRVWMAVLLHLFKVRRHGTKVAGRFCLSFFTDESAMSMEKLAIDTDDVYMHFWVATLKPLLGVSMYHDFLQTNQNILKTHFPLWEQIEDVMLLPEKHVGFRKILESIFQFLWFIPEGLKWIQKKKMEKYPVNRGPEADIVVTDHILKFHNHDRRKEYYSQWQETVGNYFGS